MLLRKIYIGFLMLATVLCFFFSLQFLDDAFCKFPLFIYVLCLITILFIIGAIKEILSLVRHVKPLHKSVIFFIVFFSLIHFFYFLSFLLNLFSKLSFIEIQDKIESDFLFQTLIEWSSKHHFYFLFGFFLFFLLIFFVLVNSFRTIHLKLTLLILLYIVFNCSCFLSLIFLSYQWFFYLFFITIFSDSFAFFGGKLFGGKLLCPKLSPKKTWSGFLCGILITLITVCLYYIKSLNMLEKRSHIVFFIIFIIMSTIVSQLGDLIVSKFKRDAKIKDFNNLFEQHGGLLDRLDSLLFLVFFVVLILYNFEILRHNIISIIVSHSLK